MSREEFERRKAEGAERNRQFEERVARMKADLEEKRRAEQEVRSGRKRFFLFR